MLSKTDIIREIDSRSNGGITVTLSGYFNSEGTCEYAIVNVDSPTAAFTISEIPLCNALDVYKHPFCYADRELTSGRLVAA